MSRICAKLGPLWATSCFPFESFNAVILKNIHGTNKFHERCVTLGNIKFDSFNYFVSFSTVTAFYTMQQLPLREQFVTSIATRDTLRRLGSTTFTAHSNWQSIESYYKSKSQQTVSIKIVNCNIKQHILLVNPS